jgi:NitT/TauT family transport system ATP-binding protein
VSICRSIAIQPEVLFLDEPFSALDYSTTREMELELLDIWQEKKVTTIFVSHDVDEAIFLADRVFILSPRPAIIKATLQIPLLRPRTAEMFISEEFLILKKSVLEAFAYDK